MEEQTFYHDDVLRPGKVVPMENQAVTNLKRKMTLDFGGSSTGMKTKQQKMVNLLQSPDLNLLKLASPELEKMIIQANGMVTTTPTPTQFIFPKHVTEEQEAYARGFVEALNNLHKTESMDGSDSEMNDSDSSASYSSAPVSFQNSILSLTTTTSLPGGLVTSQTGLNRPTTVTQLGNARFKEEPQTVPTSLTTRCNSPPMSPINMESQERIKLERKRARNRVAARKCRTRKLERISRLEDRVSDLKGQNTDLASTASALKDQVCKLKQQIIEHVNSGCQIMMSSSLNF